MELISKNNKPHIKEARDLAMGWLMTGLTILIIATLLGYLNRLTQTGVLFYSAKAWYTLMTLHGMAAFVGWGVFICMGLSFYAITNILDAPLHNIKIAKAAYWIFMVGVMLLAVATLFGNFAGSWVFLYPLPFENGGAWDNWANFVWIFGVLLAGVAILLVNYEILMTVRLAGVSIIAALGFEAFKEKPKDGYKVPTPLIPFVVNAVGMIIATIPFAVLLVVLLVESTGVTTGLDALAAKNVLWWFGHPVVYALLFPVAGFMYYMLERITGTELIGERITKLAWALAVIIQNVIGSHHVYQDLVNPLWVHVMMQILTYGITIPSLASLFVFVGQVYTKKFEWSMPARFMFLAALGWMLAGMTGVINATILFNGFIYNTLFIVAHFHTMALLNISTMVFGIAYFLVMDYSGMPVWNEKLAKIGMWTWYLGVIGAVHAWFMQGILGGVRRSYVSTPNQNLFTWISIPFFTMVLIGIYITVYVYWKTVTQSIDTRE